MNKTSMVVMAGSLAAVAVLGLRLTDVERQLAAAKSAAIEGRDGTAAAARSSAPSSSSRPSDSVAEATAVAVSGTQPMGVTKRDRREVMALQAEIARLREQLAQRPDLPTLQAVRLGMREVVGESAVVLQQSGAQLNSHFIPAEPPQAVAHWTSGPKRSWGHEQATGAPDTPQAGDIPTAWASKKPDDGVQWLKLDYDQPVDLQQINVMESHQPGAISKVAAVLPDGSESVLWEGTLEASAENERVISNFPVDGEVRAQSVKVYVDTDRVPGWNEIDAVEMVGRDGTRQWASASSSSSSYADP